MYLEILEERRLYEFEVNLQYKKEIKKRYKEELQFSRLQNLSLNEKTENEAKLK